MLIVSGCIALLNAVFNSISAGIGNLVAECDTQKTATVSYTHLGRISKNRFNLLINERHHLGGWQRNALDVYKRQVSPFCFYLLPKKIQQENYWHLPHVVQDLLRGPDRAKEASSLGWTATSAAS